MMYKWKGTKVPECKSQVACEGNYLRGRRAELGICATCEKTLERRGKVIEPRGILFKEKGERDG